MSVSQFVLESLKVIGAWPLVAFLCFVFFLISQKKAISDLIGRIIQIKFPGGGLELPKYEPDKVTQKNLPSEQHVVVTKSFDFENQVNSLDVDFKKYIILNLQSNRQAIGNMLDAIWRSSSHGLFGNDQPPEDLIEKAQLFNYQVDQKAIADLKNIEAIMLMDQPTREELIQASLKSNLLVEYFRRLAAIGWRSVLKGNTVNYPSAQKEGRPGN